MLSTFCNIFSSINLANICRITNLPVAKSRSQINLPFFHISLLFISLFILSSFLSAFLVVVYLIVILIIHVHFPSLMLAPAADSSSTYSNPPAGEAEDAEDDAEADFKFDIREAEEALASEDQEQDLPMSAFFCDRQCQT